MECQSLLKNFEDILTDRTSSSDDSPTISLIFRAFSGCKSHTVVQNEVVKDIDSSEHHEVISSSHDAISPSNDAIEQWPQYSSRDYCT